jgi:branched-chain amino acid transport system substrate-binding protein
MKKVLLAVVLAAALALVGCGGGGNESSSDSTDAEAAVTAEVLRVGLNDSFTGAGAVYGLPQQNAIRLYVEQLNAAGGFQVGDVTYTIELVEYDNKSDPTEAVSALRKLVDKDEINIILGWASSGAAKAASAVVGEEYENVMMLVGTAGEESITAQGFENVLRIRPPAGYTGDAAGRFVAEEGVKNLAIIGQLKDALYEQYTSHFVEQYEAAGGTVLTTESFALGDRDMYSQISSALAKNPDGIFVPGYVEQAAFVYRQLRENGWTGNIYGFTGGSEAQFLEVATAEQMEDVFDLRPVEGTIEALGPSAQAYYDSYVAKYGEEPTPNAIYAWDSVVALVEGIKAAGSVDDIAAIGAALRDMSAPEAAALKYVEVGGKWFDANGQTYTSNIALVFKDGKWTYVKDLPADASAYSAYMTETAQASS